MKSQKGITLISLTIYIIVLAIVIGIVSTISTYFYKNISSATEKINPWTEYTKFNSFFTEEINSDNIKVLEYANDDVNNTSYIVFDSGAQYTFIPENNSIYRNKVKICKNIEKCTFDYTIENGKNVVKVEFKAINGEIKKQTYTLKK